ncbi:MAG: phosphoribosylformylglycinamidine cyclo-ligase, partial [Bacteroidia bacterium]|nr:phosphoribosylformylglycinamidine cyclo-ligase [Bacteroidia bacterium]
SPSLDASESVVSKDWYRLLGVSAHKSFLEDLPSAHTGYFAPILPDIAGDPAYRFALHADGIGTKGVLAYLWWKETGDTSVWQHLAQDALVMNTDDLACSGITGPFVFSTTLIRNPFYIPDEVVKTIIQAVYAFAEQLRAWGIPAKVAGGETADMPDLVRTIGLEATAAARVPANHLIPLRRPDKEIAIIGLASFGQAQYEKEYNSGIGCNGITAARHLLLDASYKDKYPEAVEPSLVGSYQGTLRLSDEVESVAVGKLLLSPSRTYLPILREKYRRYLYGIIHCTGGGQRKAIKYFPKTLIRKDNLFPLPPVFRLLEGKRPWAELFETFNMGHRLELYVASEAAEELMEISRAYQVEAQRIGTAIPIEEETRIEIQFQGQEWVWSAH